MATTEEPDDDDSDDDDDDDDDDADVGNGSCDEGWSGGSSSLDGACYRLDLYPPLIPWSSAATSYCPSVRLGSFLAEVRTEDQQEFLKEELERINPGTYARL